MENNIPMLSVFPHDEFGGIGVIRIDRETYFCVEDITRALEYNDTNKAIKSYCKKKLIHTVLHPKNIEEPVEMEFIPKSDIITLIEESTSDNKNEFKDWLFEMF